MIAKEMTATEMKATGGAVSERDLSAEELDAATGGVLPEGFMDTVWDGIIKGFRYAGGTVVLRA